jgi:hypothetical protein
MKSKKKLLTAATLGSLLGLAGPVAGHHTGGDRALTQPLTSASLLGSGAAKKKAAKKKKRHTVNKNASGTANRSGNKNRK